MKTKKRLVESLATQEIPKETIDGILSPYDPDCRYVCDARIGFNNEEGRRKILTIDAEMSIPYCYYARDKSNAPTHFNATDFILCFNQLSYVLVAESVRRNLVPELEMDSVEEFQKAQMERCYIGRYREISFRAPINPSKFYGTASIERIFKTKGGVFLPSSVQFEDQRGGFAEGSSLLTVTMNKIYLKKESIGEILNVNSRLP